MVEAFIIAWNEIETIHLTIEHYQRFCDKVTILDNYSNDGTYEKAEQMCNVQHFGIKNQLDDGEYLKIKNSCYLGSKEKYVIVCDSDEILWHPNLREVLEQSDATIFNIIGWDIFSNEMPKKNYLEIQRGQFTPNYCKKVIFKPRIKINYQYGCHVCKPQGLLRAHSEPLTLFHYRNIGGYKRLSDRHKIYRDRLSQNNKIFGLGCHYSFPEQQRKHEYKAKFDASIEYGEFNPAGMDILPIRSR